LQADKENDVSQVTGKKHLPNDPVQWVKDLEEIWKSHDGVRAAQGYTDDAILYWGANQSQSGAALRERPAKWFAYATDLDIKKTYIAHTDDCIVTSWDSNYTDPDTGARVFERGIEYFYFDQGKVREQHAWQHRWQEGENSTDNSFSTD
jgi:nuclear transport factor 2 (NTF2) superfamily protein